jgi:hypothetical protein
MNITKNMVAKSDNPFAYKTFSVKGPGIFFDGKARDEWGLDTKMVSYPVFFGRFGKMDEVAEPLHKNPEAYSAYLNTLRTTYQKEHPTGKTWAEQQAIQQKEKAEQQKKKQAAEAQAELEKLAKQEQKDKADFMKKLQLIPDRGLVEMVEQLQREKVKSDVAPTILKGIETALQRIEEEQTRRKTL